MRPWHIPTGPRSAPPGRGYLGPRAAGLPSHARANPVAWGPGWVPGPAGPRGRRHGRPLRLGPPCGWPRRLGGPARAGGRQASGPKTAGVRGPASSRRQDRTATEEPVITMIFQNRCWVFRPGVEFTGKGGEEPLSGEEGRTPPLECPAARRPSAGPTWRDCGGIEDQVSPERGSRTMDGSRARRTRDRARRAWYAGWRQYRFARHYGFVSGTTTSGAARICSPSYAPGVGVSP